MARTTPGTGIPVPESADPRTITTDLWAMGSRISSLISQTSGESTTALTRAQAAEATSAAAMARAAKVQYPIEAGVTAPADPEKLWVDEGDNPSGPGVSWGELTGKPDAFPSTIPLVNGLQDALDAAGGTPAWTDVTGKPTSFPPSEHTHDDRYYTEAEVDAKLTAARPYDSGPRRFTPTGGIIDPANTGSIILHRIGNAVYCRIDGLMITAGVTDSWLWPNGIPVGFTIGEFGQVVDVTGGYTAQAGMNGAVRHRLTVYQNDLRYVGYLHGATATTVEASRSDQTRRIYGWLPAWLTPDAIPTTLPGSPA